MSTPTPPQPDPEVVVIKEKKDDGNVWLWAIFGIVLLAIILVVVGVCLANKHRKKIVYVPSSASSMPPSVASSLQGGYGGGVSSYGAMSTAPVTQSMLNMSAAPMSFLSY